MQYQCIGANISAYDGSVETTISVAIETGDLLPDELKLVRQTLIRQIADSLKFVTYTNFGIDNIKVTLMENEKEIAFSKEIVKLKPTSKVPVKKVKKVASESTRSGA